MRKTLSRAILAALPTGILALGAGTTYAQDAENKDSDRVLEEVTVVARKVEENIQDVPVAVTAIGENLIVDLNINDLSDIGKYTAGLVFDSELGRGSNRPVIRGQANILGSSGVSYFIDGVYITGSIDDYDINDVQQLEVVKGPQSALYGRNTYSGAINIITRSPSEDFGARARVQIAEDNNYEVAASMNGPFGDSGWSGGLHVRHYELGGYETNLYDGSKIGIQETNSVSGVLEFSPSDTFRLRARAYYSERDDGQPVIALSDPNDNNCFFDEGSYYNGVGRYYCGTIDALPINTDWPFQAPGAGDQVDTLQTSLRMDWTLNDEWTLTSITGYNDISDDILTDGDYTGTSFQTTNFTPNGFPFAGFEDGPPFLYAYVPSVTDFTFAITGDTTDISEELRLEFDGERSRAIIGAYYFDQDISSRTNRNITPEQQDAADQNFFNEFLRMQGVCAANPICEGIIPLGNSEISVTRNIDDQSIRNYALFGLYSYDITDAWTVTLEGRWQEEKISQTVVAGFLGSDDTVTTSASKTFDAFLPRVTVDWRVTDNNMLYLLYAQGTKPGGLNGAAAIEAGLPGYEEEDVDSIEFGSKNYLFGGTMIANFAFYYNQVAGYQLTQAVQGAGEVVTATLNSGDADIYGMEAEVTWRPLDQLRLTANYAYNHNEFVAGTDANQGVLNDVADDSLANCSTGDQFPDVPGCTSLYGSIVGNQIPRVPEHTLFVDAEWRTQLGDTDWDWYVGGNYSYEANKWAQVTNLAGTGSTTLLSARLGLTNDNWSIQFYGRNLSGETSAPSVLRYVDASTFYRAFAISPRRDTYFGLTAIMNY